MKHFLFALSFLLLNADGVFAQGYDPRVDVARLFGEQQANQPGRDAGRREQENRLAAEFDQVNREIREIKRNLRATDAHSFRRRFARARQTNEQLRERFQHGADRREIRRELQSLRAQLDHIREQLPRR
ncbi:MAG: hypothetical protein ACR2HH_00845 [Chthoniobacterales bacterium]